MKSANAAADAAVASASAAAALIPKRGGGRALGFRAFVPMLSHEDTIATAGGSRAAPAQKKIPPTGHNFSHTLTLTSPHGRGADATHTHALTSPTDAALTLRLALANYL